MLWVPRCARRWPRAAPLLLLSGLGGTLLRAAVSMISASSSSVVRIICASLLLPVLLLARFRNPGLVRNVRRKPRSAVSDPGRPPRAPRPPSAETADPRDPPRTPDPADARTARIRDVLGRYRDPKLKLNRTATSGHDTCRNSYSLHQPRRVDSFILLGFSRRRGGRPDGRLPSHISQV